MMNNSEKIRELIKKFVEGGIRQSTEDVVEYQDLVGRNSYQDLVAFARNLDKRERDHFYWCNMNCLCMETALTILQHAEFEPLLEKQERAHNDDMVTQMIQRDELEKDLRETGIQLSETAGELERVERELAYLKDRNSRLKEQNLKLAEKASKHDSIRELLA